MLAPGLFTVICLLVVRAQSQTPSAVVCPEGGWQKFKNSCVLFVNNDTATWVNARDECSYRGGKLLDLNDIDEYHYMVRSLTKQPGEVYWTRLNDFHSRQTGHRTTLLASFDFDGKLSKEQQQVLAKDNWDKEPNNNHYKNCVYTNTMGRLSVGKCTDSLPFICQAAKNNLGFCWPGWLQGLHACYKVSDAIDFRQLKTWKEAKAVCRSAAYHYGHLVDIKNTEDQSFLAQNIANDTDTYWTALNDITNEGSFVWSDNKTPLTTSNYNTIWREYPEYLAGYENCGAISSTGKWTNRQCQEEWNYVCRYDGETVADLGCGKGRVRAGTKCGKITNRMMTWDTARQQCQAQGGDLLKIASMDDKEWSRILISNDPSKSNLHSQYAGFYIGLNDKQKNGTFQWADGSASDSSFLTWYKHPSPSVSVVSCAVIVPSGQFIDFPCNFARVSYVCEDVSPRLVPLRSSSFHPIYAEKSFVVRNLNRRSARWTDLVSVDGGAWHWQNTADALQNPQLTQELVTWKHEPNIARGQCVMMTERGNLMTMRCDSPKPSICTKDLGIGNAGHAVAGSLRLVTVVGILLMACKWM